MSTEEYNKQIVDFINEELAVHEGGIVGSVSFSYDDATFNHVVSVGRTGSEKHGYGRGLLSAINDFKSTHREAKESA